ncbi:Uncharacterised protein [Escherichia coli]|nr:Uncharacterised protein [Escherichia coli]
MGDRIKYSQVIPHKMLSGNNLMNTYSVAGHSVTVENYRFLPFVLTLVGILRQRYIALLSRENQGEYTLSGGVVG